jgi:type II secretory pathway pseudopilin PulG
MKTTDKICIAVREREVQFNEIKKEGGVTLVTLIITIIILIILTGITITQLTDNGLIDRAKYAKEKLQNAQIEENAILSDYENAIDNANNDTYDSKENQKLMDEITNLKEENESLKSQIEELEKKSNKVKMVNLGLYDSRSVNTINVSSYEGYKNFTINNFVIRNARVLAVKGTAIDNNTSWILSSSYYNASTGVLKTVRGGDAENGWTMYIQYYLYLILGEIE